jgi:TPR repeat protein
MRDIVDLPLKARFCPRCGVNLLDGAGRVLPIPRAAAAAAMAPPDAPISAYTEEGCQRIAAWLALRAVLANAFASHPPTPTCVAGQRTQIVTGYANAMYHLGARYESGLPARRMPGEAVRCFIKSARLGNADARERLNATDS